MADLEENTKYTSRDPFDRYEMAQSQANTRNPFGNGNPFDENHPTIKNFWKVLHKFDKIHKEKFLRFVTSKTRAPLRGFKDLEPPFTIVNALSGKKINLLKRSMLLKNLKVYVKSA